MLPEPSARAQQVRRLPEGLWPDLHAYRHLLVCLPHCLGSCRGLRQHHPRRGGHPLHHSRILARSSNSNALQQGLDLVDGIAGTDNEETEHGLGDNVENGVKDGLLVGGDAAGALGKSPDNGVGRPGDGGKHGDLAKDLLAGGGLVGSAALKASEERMEDGHEHAHAEEPEEPLLTALDEGTDEAGDDHEEIHTKEPHGGVIGGTSETDDVEELERGGEGPVDVTSVEELAAVETTVVDAVAGGHGEVGKGGNGSDAESDDVVLGGEGP